MSADNLKLSTKQSNHLNALVLNALAKVSIGFVLALLIALSLSHIQSDNFQT